MSEIKWYKTEVVGAYTTKNKYLIAEHRFDVVADDFSIADRPKVIGKGLEIVLKSDHEAILSAERERSEGLVEALKFYADHEKMYDTAYDNRGNNLGYVRGIDEDDDMEKIEGKRTKHHGKRARLALADYEKETK